MTIQDEQWYVSYGITLLMKRINKTPFPNPLIDSIINIQLFKLIDVDYLSNIEFRRAYDIMLEIPHTDPLRYLNYRTGYVRLPFHTLIDIKFLRDIMIIQLQSLIGQIPSPGISNLIDINSVYNYFLVYVNSVNNLTQGGQALTEANILSLSIYYYLPYVYINEHIPIPGSIYQGISIENTIPDIPGGVFGSLVLSAIAYYLTTLIVSPVNLADTLTRIIGCFYLSIAVDNLFPFIRFVLGMIWGLIKSIFDGTFLTYLLKMILLLLEKIILLVIYIVLSLMQWLFWIPFLGWALKSWYDQIKNELFPNQTLYPQGSMEKLLSYSLFCIVSGPFTGLIMSVLSIHWALDIFIVVIPSLIFGGIASWTL